MRSPNRSTITTVSVIDDGSGQSIELSISVARMLIRIGLIGDNINRENAAFVDRLVVVPLAFHHRAGVSHRHTAVAVKVAVLKHHGQDRNAALTYFGYTPLH